MHLTMIKRVAEKGLLLLAGCFCLAELAPQVLYAAAHLSYQIDVRQATSKGVMVRLEVTQIPKGGLALHLPMPVENHLKAGPAIRELAFSSNSADDAGKAAKVEEGQITLDPAQAEPVVLSYFFMAHSRSDVSRGCYCDNGRCFLHSRDVLLNAEGSTATAEISFQLPKGWNAQAAQAAQENGSFALSPGSDDVFYLGKGSGSQSVVSSHNVGLVVENEDQAAAGQVARILKEEISYLQELIRIKPPRNLLAVVVGKDFKSQKADAYSLYPGGLMLVRYFPKPTPAPAEDLTFRRQIAEGLAAWFFPVIDGARESVYEADMKQYLGWKVCLKTGHLDSGEFLKIMTSGLVITEGSRLQGAVKPAPPPPEANSGPWARIGGVSRFFFADLALESFGRDNKSLADLLNKTKLPDPADASAPEPWLKRLQTDRRAGKMMGPLFPGDVPIRLNELLRPYGLTFVERQFAVMGFQVSESFVVTQIDPLLRSELRVGDRIVLVHQNRLLYPGDLLKMPSLYAQSDEVQLTVERSGYALKLRQPLRREVTASFELNKFSDSDKQVRLERFMAKANSE